MTKLDDLFGEMFGSPRPKAPPPPKPDPAVPIYEAALRELAQIGELEPGPAARVARRALRDSREARLP